MSSVFFSNFTLKNTTMKGQTSQRPDHEQAFIAVQIL